MSSEPLALDPILEELLHEVARDPRSSLLRVERPARPTRWTDSWDALSRWHPGLTSAEREILDVHRAEFATLLLRRWALEMELRPPPAQFMVRTSTAKQPAVPLDPEELDRRASQYAEEPSEGLASAALFEALPSSLQLSSEQLSSLVTTAARIHPTSAARIHSALDLVRLGQRRTAIGVLHRLLAIEQRPELRALCWQNLAYAHGDDWRPGDLVEWYRKAAQLDAPRLDALCAWLLFAAQAGMVDQVKGAALVLDATFLPDDPRIALHVMHQRRTRSDGRWATRDLANLLIDDCDKFIGATAGRVLNALR